MQRVFAVGCGIFTGRRAATSGRLDCIQILQGGIYQDQQVVCVKRGSRVGEAASVAPLGPQARITN